MTISARKTNEVLTVNISCTSETLIAEVSDGTVVSAPLYWPPRLVHATQAERDNWQFEGNGDAVSWLDLDEDILVKSLLVGWPSRDREKWFNRWSKAKRKGWGLTVSELRTYEESQKRKSTETE